MNPSTADILFVIEIVTQTECYANNPNIRWAAAEAASACEDVKVAVIPTKSVLQAFVAAMFVGDGVSI